MTKPLTFNSTIERHLATTQGDPVDDTHSCTYHSLPGDQDAALAMDGEHEDAEATGAVVVLRKHGLAVRAEDGAPEAQVPPQAEKLFIEQSPQRRHLLETFFRPARRI